MSPNSRQWSNLKRGANSRPRVPICSACGYYCEVCFQNRICCLKPQTIVEDAKPRFQFDAEVS